MEDNTRCYHDKRPLIDKYGISWTFGADNHRGWGNISSLCKDGVKYKPSLGNNQRGSFMFKDDEGIVYVVHGQKSLDNKRKMVNDTKYHVICKLCSIDDVLRGGEQYNIGWECVWTCWSKCPDKFRMKFLEFTTNSNFLSE